MEMNFEEMKKIIENLMEEDYETFIKALISIEKTIDDKETLDCLYQEYMENDEMNLLNNQFDKALYEIGIY